VTKLQTKLTLATETKHRVDADLIQNDNQTITALMFSAGKLRTLLNSSFNTMKSTETLASYLQMADILSFGISVLDADTVTMDALLTERHGNYLLEIGLRDLTNEIARWHVARNLLDIQNVIGPGGMKLTGSLQQCLDIGLTTINENTNDPRCKMALKDVTDNKGIIELVNTMNAEAESIIAADPKTAYLLATDKLFSDTGIDISSQLDHLDCLNELSTFNGIIAEYQLFHDSVADLPPMVNIADVMTEVTNISVIIDTATFMDKMNSVYDNMLGTCSWIYTSSATGVWNSYGNRVETDKYRNVLFRLAKTDQYLTNIVEMYGLLNTTMFNAFTKYNNTLYVLDDYARQYQNKTITMSQMANYWDSIKIEAKLEALTSDVDAFTYTENEIHTQFNNARDVLIEANEVLWDFKLPLYNYSTLFQSKIWTDMILVSNNSVIVTERQKIVNREYWPPYLGVIITQLFDEYSSYIRNIDVEAERLSPIYQSDILQMKLILTTFKEVTAISDDLLL
jgi:hypothetical protein